MTDQEPTLLYRGPIHEDLLMKVVAALVVLISIAVYLFVDVQAVIG